MGTRTRRLWTLISLLALIGQMVLPVAHAQTWAKQNGDPLLYAFCGQASSSLAIQQFRRSAPPELLAKLRNDHAQKAVQQTCNLCASVHGQHLAGAPDFAFSLAPTSAASTAAFVLPAAVHARRVAVPPLRGPPAALLGVLA